MKILDPIVITYLKEDVFPLMKYPLEEVSDILLEDTLDYDDQTIVIKKFVDNLEVYTHSDLGTSDANVLVDFSSNIFVNYFIANVNTTPEYLLCFTFNGDKIDLTVPLENYTP